MTFYTGLQIFETKARPDNFLGNRIVHIAASSKIVVALLETIIILNFNVIPNNVLCTSINGMHVSTIITSLPIHTT
jgi:hypothetical protein